MHLQGLRTLVLETSFSGSMQCLRIACHSSSVCVGCVQGALATVCGGASVSSPSARVQVGCGMAPLATVGRGRIRWSWLVCSQSQAFSLPRRTTCFMARSELTVPGHLTFPGTCTIQNTDSLHSMSLESSMRSVPRAQGAVRFCMKKTCVHRNSATTHVPPSSGTHAQNSHSHTAHGVCSLPPELHLPCRELPTIP